MAPRLRLPLRPFELVTYGLVLAIVLFLRWRGIRLDWRTVDYMADAMLYRFPGVLAMGVVLHLAWHLVRWRSPLGWLRDAVRPPQLLLLARVWLAAMAMTYAYSWLKVSVPLLTHTLHDAALWRLDRTLHFGISPSIFAVELFVGASPPWIDFWYALWITTVLAVQSVIFLSIDPAKRRNFALACTLLWLAGATLYATIPAVGPKFFTPDLFAALEARMPYVSGMSARLWASYASIVAGRDAGTVYQLQPFLAVAAMPSLHVGAHWMFAVWAKRHARRWFLPFALATAATFAGSLLTGWHYAVDGYAGMLLAWFAVRAADLAEPAGRGRLSPPSRDERVGEQQPGDERDRDQEHAKGRLDARHDVPLEQ